MAHPKIKCYLCGEDDATQLTPDATGYVIVECKQCANRYQLTDEVLKFFFEREDEKNLSQEDREKLSRWVYNHVALIDRDRIKKETGKEPRGNRY